MKDLEKRLEQLLADTAIDEQAAIIQEMKAIALESYRNGHKAGAPRAHSGAAKPSGKTALAKARQ